MTRRCAAVAKFGMVLCALLSNSCGGSEFPVSPTPVATSPVTVQQGSSYQGTIVLPGGDTTGFNMTLIARGLAQLASNVSLAPAPSKTLATASANAAAVDVSGNYATARGVRGAVRGTLAGSLDNGFFTGTLTTDGAGCDEERRYSGPMTSSGIAWQAGAWLRTCPVSELTFSVQIGQSHGALCTYTPSVTSASISGSGGTGSVTVEASPTCPWLAEAPEPWITITGDSTHVGSGTIEFRVQPNPVASERQASLRIAGHTVTIEQGPACRFSLSSGAASVAGTGGRVTVAITAPASCSWRAEPLVDWITVVPSEGMASATLTFSVAANSGPQREGSVQVADRTFTILQGPAPVQCTTAIAPSAVRLEYTGGSGSIEIQAPPGCSWSAETSVAWLTFLGPATGSGPGTVSYSVQQNLGATTRTGTAQIAGQTFTVVQLGTAQCEYAIAPAGVSLPQAGSKGTVAITTRSGCPWSAQSLDNWIVILNVSSGAGSDSVTYLVNPNFGPARFGAMRIAGYTFTVDQASGCTYGVNPATWNPPGGAGSQTVTVSSPAGCAWTPTVSADWITVAGIQGSGGGDGVFTIRVEVFTSSTLQTRTGTVTVGTATVTITQTSRYP